MGTPELTGKVVSGRIFRRGAGFGRGVLPCPAENGVYYGLVGWQMSWAGNNAMSVPSDLIAAGLALHRSGRFAEAEATYRQALAAAPRNADILNLLGAVCINLGQLPAAEEHLEAALRLNPSHSAAHDNLGVLLVNQQRLEEAIASFRRAVALIRATCNRSSTWPTLCRAPARRTKRSACLEWWRIGARHAALACGSGSVADRAESAGRGNRSAARSGALAADRGPRDSSWRRRWPRVGRRRPRSKPITRRCE